MKNIFFLLLITLGVSTATNAQQKPAENPIQQSIIPVRGDCDNCKKNIEKAASYVKGVKKATWDKEQEVLTVIFRKDKTSELAIQEAIAKAGYDTRDVKANEQAYNELPECCHYRSTPKH